MPSFLRRRIRGGYQAIAEQEQSTIEDENARRARHDYLRSVAYHKQAAIFAAYPTAWPATGFTDMSQYNGEHDLWACCQEKYSCGEEVRGISGVSGRSRREGM